MRTDRRLEALEASLKRIEFQVGQLAKEVRRRDPGKLPSQPEQAKAVTVLRSGKTVAKVDGPEKSVDKSTSLDNSRTENEAGNEELSKEEKREHEKQASPSMPSKQPSKEENPLNTLHRAVSPSLKASPL